MENCINEACPIYGTINVHNCRGGTEMMQACKKYLTCNLDAVATSPACNAGLKGRLIAATASLSLHKLSEFDDDYPQRFPKRVLREIEKHNDHLRDIASELMSIKDAL
jgi:hypothetical protein